MYMVKILNYIKRLLKNYVWSLVVVLTVFFGYENLHGAQNTQTNYRHIEVQTEKLESGLEATVVSSMVASWYDDVSIVVDNQNNPHIIYRNNDNIFCLLNER